MKKIENRSDLERLLDFTKLTHEFQRIERLVRATGELRWERNPEHVTQLLLIAWYWIDRKGLKLNLHKVMLYILVHDMPEVYARDVCAFTDKQEVVADKARKERKARKRLFREFPDFPNFHSLLEAYEQRSDKEARFVYALDKLVPFFNIMLDQGLTWRQFNSSFNRVMELKEKKIRTCPICAEILDDVIIELRNRQGELFPDFAPPLLEEQILPYPQGRLDMLEPIHLQATNQVAIAS